MQKKSRTDKSAKEVDPLVPAFTRRREVFAGRLAMFGFAASLIGEVTGTVLWFPSCGLLALRSRTRFFRPPYCLQIASGKGVLGQLALETGLPQSVIEIGLVAGIGYNLISVSLMV